MHWKTVWERMQKMNLEKRNVDYFKTSLTTTKNSLPIPTFKVLKERAP